jgi:hypothetical protein
LLSDGEFASALDALDSGLAEIAALERQAAPPIPATPLPLRELWLEAQGFTRRDRGASGKPTRKSMSADAPAGSPRYLQQNGRWVAVCRGNACRPIRDPDLLRWLNA